MGGLVPWAASPGFGSANVRPPLLDVTVATPVSLTPPSVLFVASRPTAYAVPACPIETHGSDARLYGAPVKGSGIALGAQALNGSGVSPQVAPPTKLKPSTRPWAPPFHH